jgi:hypothetical protein
MVLARFAGIRPAAVRRCGTPADYLGNTDRLRRIRATYDPEAVFAQR